MFLTNLLKEGTRMNNKVNVYKVRSLSIVDPTKYKEGDFFITNQSVAILANGKIEGLPTKKEVEKMIKKAVKDYDKTLQK